MDRRLVAILAADVVGYSRLMGEDDDATVRALRDARALIAASVQKNGGRVINTAGDSLLVEFQSVVAAVRCGIEIQHQFRDRNAEVPASRRLEFRIGINQGEIIVDDDDVYGDGINVAARIQAIAHPGSVAISGRVHEDVAGRLGVQWEDAGEHDLKNIARPIRVWHLSPRPVPIESVIDRVEKPEGKIVMMTEAPSMTPHVSGGFHSRGIGMRVRRGHEPRRRSRILIAGATFGAIVVAGSLSFISWLQAPPRVSDADKAQVRLAVLGFQNLGGDSEQAMIAQGLSDDLLTDLSRVPGLFVVSREAAADREATEPLKQVADRLGVRYILDGSVRRVGDDVRISTQVTDTETGQSILASRFDGTWSEIFDLQKRVAANVASTFQLRVSRPGPLNKIGGTENAAAYEEFLKGYVASYEAKPEAAAVAVRHYQEATRLDPKFGRAWAEMALVYWNALGFADREQALGIAHEEIMPKVLELFAFAEKWPSSSYYQLSSEILVNQGKAEESVLAASKAIALDPSDPAAFEEAAQALIYAGRAKDSIDYLDAANRVDPGGNTWRIFLRALACFSVGDLKAALEEAERIDDGPEVGWASYAGRFLLVSIHGLMGRTQEGSQSREALDSMAARMGDGRKANALIARGLFPYHRAEDTRRLIKGLVASGVPEVPEEFQSLAGQRLS